MAGAYLPIEGNVIRPDELRIRRARAVAVALDKLDYVFLLECHRKEDTGQEILVFESEVELGQIIRNDIRSRERLAIIFDPSDDILPDAISLRDDFPQVPHLNLREHEFPRSLCLYEETPQEAYLRWTAVNFIGRIRSWLALTARGTLHADDQPLEPLLQTSPVRIVLPHDLLAPERNKDIEFIAVVKAVRAGGRFTLIAQYEANNQQDPPEYVATVLVGLPQQHGIIRHVPANLRDLHEFAERAAIDLLSVLRTRIREWFVNKPHGNFLKAKLLLILVLPKTRPAAGLPKRLTNMHSYYHRQYLR